MEDSKKIQGKITPFGERIVKVLKDNGLLKSNGEVNYSEAERLCGIKGTGIAKAVQGNGMHDGNLEKFLGTFHVERDWLLHGNGPMKNEKAVKNPTPASNSTDNTEKPLGEIYRNIVEGSTEYILIPRSVLQEKYRLVPLEQIQKDKDDAQKKSAHIDALLEMNKVLVASLTSLRSSGQPVKLKEAK